MTEVDLTPAQQAKLAKDTIGALDFVLLSAGWVCTRPGHYEKSPADSGSPVTEVSYAYGETRVKCWATRRSTRTVADLKFFGRDSDAALMEAFKRLV